MRGLPRNYTWKGRWSKETRAMYEPGPSFIDCKWDKNDEITMILDMKQKILSNGRNDKYFLIVFDGMTFYEDTYMAVGLSGREISVELLSFVVTR